MDLDLRTQAFALIDQATTLQKAGQLSQARKLWQQAESVAHSIKLRGWQGWQHTDTLRTLSKALAKAHQWQEAERITTSITDLLWRMRTLRSLAKAFAKDQQWQEAERITHSIDDASYRAVALRCLAKDLAKAHQWQEAERVASSIDDAANQAVAFHCIATSFTQAGQGQQAQQFLQQAAFLVASLARSAPVAVTYRYKPWSSVETLRDLVTILTKAHSWQEAEQSALLIPMYEARMTALCDLALALEQAKYHSRAQHIWQKAEDLAIRHSRGDSLWFLTVTLAKVHRWQEAERMATSIDLNQASWRESALRDLSAALTRQLGAEHPETLRTRQHLATLYRYQRKYEQAQEIYEQVLASSEQQLGTEHPDTLIARHSLAILSHQQGKYKQAQQLYEQVLVSYEQQLGAEHPDTLSTRHNLAFLYRDQGKYEQAQQLYEHVLASRERQLGSEHPSTRRIRENLKMLSQQARQQEQNRNSGSLQRLV